MPLSARSGATMMPASVQTLIDPSTNYNMYGQPWARKPGAPPLSIQDGMRAGMRPDPFISNSGVNVGQQGGGEDQSIFGGGGNTTIHGGGQPPPQGVAAGAQSIFTGAKPFMPPAPQKPASLWSGLQNRSNPAFPGYTPFQKPF